MSSTISAESLAVGRVYAAAVEANGPGHNVGGPHRYIVLAAPEATVTSSQGEEHALLKAVAECLGATRHSRPPLPHLCAEEAKTADGDPKLVKVWFNIRPITSLEVPRLAASWPLG